MKRHLLFSLAMAAAWSAAPGASSSIAQGWKYTTSLNVAKRFFHMTVLPDGKILTTGGHSADRTPHRECEIFDPATATWTLTSSMEIGRLQESTVRLLDGRIAVFGGQTDGAYDGGWPVQTDLVEIYDPATATWSEGGHLNIARQHQTATLLPDGRVFVAAGLHGVDPIADCEIWDPTTLTSKTVASMHQNRYEHQGISLADGKVLITGGRIGGWDGVFMSESEIYDPVTDSWTVVDPMHQSRMRGLLTQFSDGTILCAAGRNSSTSTAPGSELLDEATGTWTETDPMKQPCTWLACVQMPDDRYLATGGFVDATWTTSTDVVPTPTCEWYDKMHSRWYYAPNLNEARAEHAAVYVHQESNSALPTDMILVGGGIIGNDTYTATCEVLDVGVSAVQEYRAMPQNQTAACPTSGTNSYCETSIVDNATASPTIHYRLAENCSVRIQLLSADGSAVREWSPGTQGAGEYDLSLNGRGLPSGIYLAVVTAGPIKQTVKIAIRR